VNRQRSVVTVALALLAAASSIGVWQLRRDEAPPVLLGPPRSDYVLIDFDLLALDLDGKESFWAAGPRLTRHPGLGTLDIEQPRFSSPDKHGAVWTSRADRAFVNREGTELQLLQAAEVRGPAPAVGAPILLRSEALTLYPREQRLVSDVAVTVTEPGSILSATGLRADLNAQRVELLKDVRIRHEASRDQAKSSAQR